MVKISPYLNRSVKAGLDIVFRAIKAIYYNLKAQISSATSHTIILNTIQYHVCIREVYKIEERTSSPIMKAWICKSEDVKK